MWPIISRFMNFSLFYYRSNSDWSLTSESDSPSRHIGALFVHNLTSCFIFLNLMGDFLKSQGKNIIVKLFSQFVNLEGSNMEKSGILNTPFWFVWL